MIVSSIDTITILFCLFDDSNKSPSLVFRERSCFHNFNLIADIAFVVFIVSLELYGSIDNLLLKRVLNTVKDGNYDCLIHLVAGYDTNSGLSEISFHFLSPFPLTPAFR